MICRICGANEAEACDEYRPYHDYACTVYDCHACGCRFVNRDASIYEALHATATSSYRGLDQFAREVQRLFDAGDAAALRDKLCTIPKYRFVIERIEARAPRGRLLEVGCAKGHLTAYFLLKGYDVLGVDVSPTAVRVACDLFGQHFATPDAPVVRETPYAVIYHVGTIGCVDAPITFTHDLLAMLAPGGSLLFNAPDVEACRQFGLVWVMSTPPPDLVTLFPAGFWPARFTECGTVEVALETLSGYVRFKIFLKRLLRRSLLPLPTRTLFVQDDDAPVREAQQAPTPSWKQALTGYGKRAIGRITACRIVEALLPKYRSDIGVYVCITRRP